jgi:hypothetical protein
MKFTKSSGNVFLDLGFAPEEAESLLLESQRRIKLEKLKQRYKELCDEEYQIQCDSSGDVPQGLSMALGMLQLQIEQLEKDKEFPPQKTIGEAKLKEIAKSFKPELK